jgi:hypothetical protein
MLFGLIPLPTSPQNQRFFIGTEIFNRPAIVRDGQTVAPFTAFGASNAGRGGV